MAIEQLCSALLRLIAGSWIPEGGPLLPFDSQISLLRSGPSGLREECIGPSYEVRTISTHAISSKCDL